MREEGRESALQKFEEEVGYQFQDRSLLNLAFTHTSYANETHLDKSAHNERLEFLGDAVLELIFSDLLYRRFEKEPEGDLTRRRAQLVCEASFSYIAEKLGMGALLLLGKGEEAGGGRKKPSILSDCFEAFCGAVYLDGGYDWLYGRLKDSLDHLIAEETRRERIFVDHKTLLQEWMNHRNLSFSYQLVREEGPDHEKRFTMALYVRDKKICEAVGGNKKKAEQAAAKIAYEEIQKTGHLGGIYS